MLRFDLNDLRIFLALTRTLNIAQAAEFIGLTPSAVSLRLKKLEESFGVQLFVREPRGLILTHAGIALLKEAQRLSDEAAALEQTMNDVNSWWPQILRACRISLRLISVAF